MYKLTTRMIMVIVITLMIHPMDNANAETSNIDIDVEGQLFEIGMVDPLVEKEDVEISSRFSFYFEDDESVIIKNGGQEIEALYTFEDDVIKVTLDDGETQILDIVALEAEPMNDKLYYATIANLNIENEEVMDVVDYYLIENALQDQLLLFYHVAESVKVEDVAGFAFNVGGYA